VLVLVLALVLVLKLKVMVMVKVGRPRPPNLPFKGNHNNPEGLERTLGALGGLETLMVFAPSLFTWAASFYALKLCYSVMVSPMAPRISCTGSCLLSMDATHLLGARLRLIFVIANRRPSLPDCHLLADVLALS
jgi:hypothetical protein